MAIKLKGREPGRNDPCPCGSGLKYKYCHGDAAKREACNALVREHMLKLIQQEQKKRGLVPYRYTCNGCGHGFDEAVTSSVANYNMCPKCDNTDIKENVEEE